MGDWANSDKDQRKGGCINSLPTRGEGGQKSDAIVSGPLGDPPSLSMAMVSDLFDRRAKEARKWYAKYSWAGHRQGQSEHCQTTYRARLKGGPQVWWIMFLSLLATFVWACLQHSRNLGTTFQAEPCTGRFRALLYLLAHLQQKSEARLHLPDKFLNDGRTALCVCVNLCATSPQSIRPDAIAMVNGV